LLVALLITVFNLSGGHTRVCVQNFVIIYVLTLKAKKKAAQV